MKKYYKEMDILRGMAISMVLLYHAVIVYPVNLHEITWCRTLHSFLWCLEMPLFFLVSGFCFSYGGGYGGYLLKKGKRILVPHVVFALADILPRIIPNPLVNEQSDASGLLKEFLLYGGSDWFLWVIFLIFLIFPAAHLFCQKVRYGRAAALAGSALLFYISGELPDFWLVNMAAEFFFYFYIGYFIRQTGYEKFKTLLNRPVFAVLSAAVTAAAFYWRLTDGNSMTASLLTALAGGFLCWCAAGALCRGPALVQRVLCAFGKYSLQMYLLGGYALVASRTLLVSVLGITAPAVLIAGNFMIDAALTQWISRHIFERFRLLRGISGLDGGVLKNEG